MSGNARQCTATSKRTGNRCKANAVNGRDVCYHHGGKSLQGSAVATFQTGRYSRYLPERLAERYEEAASDPELLSLREDVALLDTRLSQLIARADTGESAEAWKRVQKTLKDLQKAEAGGKPERKKEARWALEDAIEQGGTDIEVWTEIGFHLERRRKLTESERKRLIDAEQMVRADQAMSFVAALVASVRKHVEDPRVLAAISADISAIVHQDVSGGGKGALSQRSYA